MGQIADDMANGLACSWCGVFFAAEHGYPVLCEECWEDGRDAAGRAGLQRATNEVFDDE